VRERVRGVELLVLESNYEPELLQADTRRPWSLKQRISGRHGHLSNQDARTFLSERHAEEPSLREVFLAHLSRDCNSLDAIAREFAPLTAPAAGGARFRITAVAPGTGTPVLEW
jgi:phosphoribosyl 1,2-cyclic phosphodiesterase